MKYLFIVGSILLAGCAAKEDSGIVAGGTLGGNGMHFSQSTMAETALDEQDRLVLEQASPKTVARMDRAEPLTVIDIIKLHENGVNDATIIHYIRSTRTIYNLSPTQIKMLKQAGVSERVINYVIDTGR